MRQFHQFGAEFLGSAEPHADVEIIALTMHIFRKIGLPDVKLTLNSVGDPACRESYRTILKDYIRPRLLDYCEDCQRRFEENPMRILDCKKIACTALNMEAPKIADYLCEDCRNHFDELRHQLDLLEISYELNPFLVRGLDYYTRTVFEILSDRLGAQNAICGGGRYDLLAEELGGEPAPAVGFAAGIERILMALDAAGIEIGTLPRLDVFIVSLGEQARQQSLFWLQKIRQAGIKADADSLKRSIKAQFREANRQNARFVLVLGDDEIVREEFSVKLMDQGEQISVSFEQVIGFLKQQTN
jgi:histidyl-tRNA synthetase